jgi:hypothetical protein
MLGGHLSCKQIISLPTLHSLRYTDENIQPCINAWEPGSVEEGPAAFYTGDREEQDKDWRGLSRPAFEYGRYTGIS